MKLFSVNKLSIMAIEICKINTIRFGIEKINTMSYVASEKNYNQRAKRVKFLSINNLSIINGDIKLKKYDWI